MLVDTSSGVPICYAVCFVAPETAGFTPGFDPCQQSQPMDQQQQRMKVGALIVIEVHARDVVDRLIGAEVAAVNDFDWVAQMRYY